MGANPGRCGVSAARRMTAGERALMRAIVVWRRANDVHYYRARPPIGGFVAWSESDRNGKEVAVHFKRDDDGWYLEMTIGMRQELRGIDITDRWSLTQAVDVLVSLDYLPARFSSAYRAGWHAAQQWYDDQARDEDEFNRLFHDPHNISFPAGVDA